MQVDNLILEKCLGKGSFGEVYLSRKCDNDKIFATKKYEREKIDKTEALKYLRNEILILQTLNHPNIVKFEDIKKTKNHYYIVMEYCNGGELAKALEKYIIINGRPFPEELVQYFMKQIISAFNYIHSKRIMHRDIKLENILLNYDNEQDKKDFNLMKAQIKIIDFGFSCKLDVNSLAYTAIGNPINMDPLILQKLHAGGRRARKLGYDIKADIWSLGSICYEMLIGRSAFDAVDMDDLVDKIEDGKYTVPTNLSKEVVSFLNGMLQYDSKLRYSCEQLINHPFLTKNVSEFQKINLTKVSKKIKKNELEIDVKKNKSIWAIFNEEDEQTLTNIGQLPVIPELNEENNNNNMNQIPNNFNNNQMSPYPPNMNNQFSNQPNIYPNNNIYGPILPSPMEGIPGNNQMSYAQGYPPQFIPGNQHSAPNIHPPNTMIETNYVYSGGIYSNI